MPPECLLLPSLLAWVNQIPPGASLLAWNCWACEGLHELRPEVCFIFPAVREAGRKPELGCCFSPPPHQGQTQRDSPRHGCLSQGAARRLPCRSAKLPSRKRKRNRRGKKKKKNTICYQERKKPAHAKQQAHLCKQHKVSVCEGYEARIYPIHR